MAVAQDVWVLQNLALSVDKGRMCGLWSSETGVLSSGAGRHGKCRCENWTRPPSLYVADAGRPATTAALAVLARQDSGWRQTWWANQVAIVKNTEALVCFQRQGQSL